MDVDAQTFHRLSIQKDLLEIQIPDTSKKTQPMSLLLTPKDAKLARQN